MFTKAQQTGADQILESARRVAAELGAATGRSLRVVGWRGSGGKMDWEYVVEVDGTGCALEVGESDLLTFRGSGGKSRSESATRCSRRWT
jgi:hypothetical protein